MNNIFLALLNKAYVFLKFRPRTKKEVRNYLLKKIKTNNFSSSDVEKVIKRLEEENLIDDQKFLSWFVEQSFQNKPKSLFLLKKELIRLGVEESLVENFFLEHSFDERELAFKALLAKWKHFKNLPKEKIFVRAINFLRGRGFSFEVSKKVFDKINQR